MSLSPPTSRADQRKARRQQLSVESTPRSSLDIPASSSSITPSRTRTPSPLPTLTMSSPRLFIASIGNPAPYLSTLHSAGHTVNHQLAFALHLPSFTKSRAYANGLLSTSTTSPYTLWQSPALMNVSGVALSTAYKQFLKDNANEGRLVVLHDELELGLGEVKVRSGTASHKGHNGLKSIKERMGGVDYKRISIGIGRPLSREPGDVAGFVLRKMTQVEKMKIEGAVGRVVEELIRLGG